jgi:hypothetical protein
VDSRGETPPHFFIYSIKSCLEVNPMSFHILPTHILHKHVYDETNKKRKAKKQPTKYKNSHPCRSSLMQNNIILSGKTDFQKYFLLT